MPDPKRIGFVRTDYHSLIYAYCLGEADRYQYRLTGGQLWVLEHESAPTLPVCSTTVAGCCNPPNERTRYMYHECGKRRDIASLTGDDLKEYEETERRLGVKLTPEQFGKAFNCPVYDSVEEMADPEKIDAAFIGNCSWWADDHLELAMPFIKAGIPMFIDKPFADNAVNAARILNAAREYNTPIYSASILLYVGANRDLPKKKLGDPKLVVSTFARHMEARNGSVHLLSNLLGAVWHLKGEYEVVSMQYIGNEHGRDPSRHLGDGEAYRVLFADGTIGILNSNDTGTYFFRCDVYGSQGVSTEYVVIPTLRSGIVEISSYFAQMLETGIPPLHYDRIFEFVACLDAGILSREENGREVTIQEIADRAGYKLHQPMECLIRPQHINSLGMPSALR